MKKYTSEYSVDELEMIILERVIEDVGLIISPDHEIFKNVMTVAQEFHGYLVETLVDHAMDIALIYDEQMDKKSVIGIGSVVRVNYRGLSYIGVVVNINLYREPAMTYAIEVHGFDDFVFVGSTNIPEVLVW